MNGTQRHTTARTQQPVIRGIALERLAAAGMVLIVVLCGLMISPTVKQSAAAFDKIDTYSPASVPMIDERSEQSAQATAEVLPENMDEDSFSSRIIDRICRKFEFGFRLVGGTEISTIYRSPQL